METYEMISVNHSFFEGGGEAWMEHVSNTEDGNKWHLALSWGLDGWDLGEYPYYVYAYADGGRMVAEYCEGDVTVWMFVKPEGGLTLLDSFAEKQWRREGSSARLDEKLKEFPEGELPDKYRGPFSWKRLTEEKNNNTEVAK